MTNRELLILTGMSGAGRSTVAHALEDLGWHVVDNLPPALLPELATEMEKTESSVAVVVDVRGGKFFDALASALEALSASDIKYRLLFLDASDQALVQRFESTRRPHPLQSADRIVDGIARERAKLEELRSQADVVIDTSNLNVHQLEKRTAEIFAAGMAKALRINVLSFGYKYGIPVDADLVADLRFLPNPYWDPKLKDLTGLDAAVNDYVVASDQAQEFLTKYAELIDLVEDGYLREGKRFVTIAMGCTGGKHRSVAMAENLSARLVKSGVEVRVVHRDLGRE